MHSLRVLHFSILCCLGLFGLAVPQIASSAQMPSPAVETAYDIDWRPDGSTLAVTGSSHLWLFNAAFQPVSAYPYPPVTDMSIHAPQAVEWSSDGMWIAAILRGGWLLIWSYPKGELVFARQLTERNDPDTIRWHPTQPLLSTYRYIVNIESNTIEQTYTFDWRYSTNDAPVEHGHTGEVFWSTSGKQLIRPISEANCGPCSEYGVFDTDSEALVQSLGSKSGAWDSFIWSEDNRYRIVDHVLINDLIFDSQIERLVYVETGAYEHFRMPAMFVVNTFENQDVINHQVVYPVSITHIDWIPSEPFMVTALNCAGEILDIDIREVSVREKATMFAPYTQNDESPCQRRTFPGYSNP